MTKNVYNCHHGLIFILWYQKLSLRTKLKFTRDALRQMCVESQNGTLKKQTEKLAICKLLP